MTAGRFFFSDDLRLSASTATLERREERGELAVARRRASSPEVALLGQAIQVVPNEGSLRGRWWNSARGAKHFEMHSKRFW